VLREIRGHPLVIRGGGLKRYYLRRQRKCSARRPELIGLELQMPAKNKPVGSGERSKVHKEKRGESPRNGKVFEEVHRTGSEKISLQTDQG